MYAIGRLIGKRERFPSFHDISFLLAAAAYLHSKVVPAIAVRTNLSSIIPMPDQFAG